MSQDTASSHYQPKTHWVISSAIAWTIALLAIGALLTSVADGYAGQTDHGVQAPVAEVSTQCNGESDASNLSTGPLLQNAD